MHMTSTSKLAIATALVFGVSTAAFAQGATKGSTQMGGSAAVNGQQQGSGPNAKTYGVKKHTGREQPEQKQDMGTDSGK
jgi:uncharacterized protein YdeI (BOF family)